MRYLVALLMWIPLFLGVGVLLYRTEPAPTPLLGDVAPVVKACEGAGGIPTVAVAQERPMLVMTCYVSVEP